MSAPTASSAPPGDQYRTAIESYRSTLKWVISAFAAVGGALIVGLQLTTLGSLHGSRLLIAFAAAIVAFAGIVLVIFMAARGLVPVGATHRGLGTSRIFKPLRENLAEDPTPLRGQGTSPGELADEYDAAIAKEREAYEQHRADPANQGLREAYREAGVRRKALAPVARDVVSLGILLRTRELFAQAMYAVAAGVALAAAGALAFAYITNPKQPTPATQTVNCAAYYLQLDALADDEPGLKTYIRTRQLGSDARARACGLTTSAALADFMAQLR